MTSWILLVGLFLAVYGVTADSVWPNGQHLTYEYSANVQVGTLEPAHFASRYTINGKLHLQAHNDEAVIKLDDIKYQLYNGDVSEKQQSSPLPLPQEAVALSSPFRVQYKDGKSKKLFTEDFEPLWSLNMKKGLASLLQLDLTQRMSMDVPSAFWGEEDTIFGTCDVAYSFINDGEYNTVTKTVNPVTCKGYPSRLHENFKSYTSGQYSNENPLSSLYKRVYRIKVGGIPVVTEINSEFSVGYMPLNAESDITFVQIRQSAHLLTETPIEKQITITDNREVQDLTYSHPQPDNVLGSARDWTLGRYKADSDGLVSKVIALLDDILEYQEGSHVDVEAPNVKRSSAVSLLVNMVLGRLNVEDLSSLYGQLSQDNSDWSTAKRDLFVKLLPQVGTQASAITIRNLVRKHKVKTAVAVSLLQSLPFNIRQPSEKLLQEMEELTNLNEEYPEELRNSALLSFATLVYETVKDNSNEEFRNRTVDKYADIYFKRFIDAKDDYATQFIYVQGLSNMHVGKAALFLESLLLEGENFSRHIRHLVSWYVSRSVNPNYNKAYRLYWPILVDNKQHLQLRGAALTVLLESASSLDHFMNLHNYMSRQRNNVHLYKLYYKILTAMSSTTDPYYGKTAEYAARVLHFTLKPLVDHWGTGTEVYDYTDKKYGFGKILHLHGLADQATGYPSVMIASVGETLNGRSQFPLSVYFKVEGLDQLLWEAVYHSDEEPTKAPPKMGMMGILRKHQHFSADEVINKVSQIQSKLQKPIHIEVAVFQHDQAIFTLFANNSVLDRLLQSDIPHRLKELKNTVLNQNAHYVSSPSSAEYHIPTDLGVPLAILKDSPSILSVFGGIKDELEMTLRQSSSKNIWTTILNPVAGTWHGSYRSTTQDTQLPIRLGLHQEDRALKVVFGSPVGVEQLNATIGSRWYTQSQTYLYEEEANNNLLGASCSACKRVVPVTKGKGHLKEVVLAHTKVPGTGLVADVRVFDCERDISIPSLKKLVGHFLDQADMNSHDDWRMRLLLGLNHLLTYNELSPPSGQCGVLARLIPDPDIGQGSQVEVKIKVTGGEVPGGNIVLEGFKFRVDGQWILKGSNGDAIEKTKITADISSTAGNEDSSLNIQLANEGYKKRNSKWCWQFSKKFPARGEDALAFGWGNEEVDSQLKISVGSFAEDSDGLCPSDGASIVINQKGEISDEQKQRAQGDDWPYGQCNEDKQKSEWEGYKLVPNTQACYQGSIILTAARKVTYSVSHSKLPAYIEEIISIIEEKYRSTLAPHFSLVSGGQLAQPGTAEVVMQYSAYKPTLDVTVRTPSRHYQYAEVPTGDSSADEYNPGLDNTHYSRFHLFIENNGISKPCIISSENVYTSDNATVPHKQGSEYVLVAGDSSNPKRFSAYVKSQGGNKPLVVKLVNDGVTLEVSRDGASLNGKSVSLEKGVQYPPDDPFYAIRAWQIGDVVLAYSRRTAVFAYYTGYAVDVEQPVTNRGRASGLCGNLNGDPFDDY